MAIGDNTKRNVKHITDKHKAKPTATMKYQGALLIPIEITPRPQTTYPTVGCEDSHRIQIARRRRP